MAEGEGFEPPEALPPQRFSSSTTNVRDHPPASALISGSLGAVRQRPLGHLGVRPGCRQRCRRAKALYRRSRDLLHRPCAVPCTRLGSVTPDRLVACTRIDESSRYAKNQLLMSIDIFHHAPFYPLQEVSDD